MNKIIFIMLCMACLHGCASLDVRPTATVSVGSAV